MAIAEISAALAGLKTATDMARALVSGNAAYEAAEFKLKAADLMASLADARVALVEAQDVVSSLQAEVERLNVSLEDKATVFKRGSAYYQADENGVPVGDAYCMRCWEEDHKLRHLAYGRFAQDPNVCPSCKSKYGSHDTYAIAGQG